MRRLRYCVAHPLAGRYTFMVTMMIEECALCLQVKELKVSHLMPKGLYKKLRKSDCSGQIILSQSHNRTSAFTDMQVTDNFLCGECEQKFSRNGENLVVRDCYNSKTEVFPLRSKFDESKVIARHFDKQLLDHVEANINRGAYLYFAASIVWRASAWKRKENSNQNSLGPVYQEQIRKYLNNESTFPENVYLIVYIDTDLQPLPMISFPVSTKKVGYHQHIFYIPGVRFLLLVGHDIGELKEYFNDRKSKVVFLKYSYQQHPDCSFVANSLSTDFKPNSRLRDEIRKNV